MSSSWFFGVLLWITISTAGNIVNNIGRDVQECIYRKPLHSKEFYNF